MGTIIKPKRGLSEDRLKFIPAAGELILETDTMLMYVGDGETPGGLRIQNCQKAVDYILNRNKLKANLSSLRSTFFLEDWEDLV